VITASASRVVVATMSMDAVVDPRMDPSGWMGKQLEGAEKDLLGEMVSSSCSGRRRGDSGVAGSRLDARLEMTSDGEGSSRPGPLPTVQPHPSLRLRLSRGPFAAQAWGWTPL
jgi:hypothetical protein